MDQSKNITKYQKQVKKHFADFLSMPIFAQNFRDKPFEYYQEYLNDEDDEAYISLRSERRFGWHFAQYANAVCTESRYPWDEFALATRYAHANVKFEEAFAESGKDGSVLLWVAAFSFSLRCHSASRVRSKPLFLNSYRPEVKR